MKDTCSRSMSRGSDVAASCSAKSSVGADIRVGRHEHPVPDLAHGREHLARVVLEGIVEARAGRLELLPRLAGAGDVAVGELRRGLAGGPGDLPPPLERLGHRRLECVHRLLAGLGIALVGLARLGDGALGHLAAA